MQEAYNHEKNDEPIKAFLACSQSDCADPKYKLLLESEPLVTSIAGGKKYWDLPTPFFKDKQIPFKEILSFVIPVHLA